MISRQEHVDCARPSFATTEAVQTDSSSTCRKNKNKRVLSKPNPTQLNLKQLTLELDTVVTCSPPTPPPHYHKLFSHF